MASPSTVATPAAPQNDFWKSIPLQLRQQITSTLPDDEIKQLDDSSNEKTPTEKYKSLELLALNAVSTKENTLGPNHAETIATMHTLAMLQGRLGENVHAEITWRKILAIEENDNGKGSSLAVRSNLGVDLIEQGKYQDAEENARQLMPILEEKIGKNSPQVLGVLRQLIVAVAGQGRHEEAKDLKTQGLELVKTLSGGKFEEYQQGELDAMKEVVV